MRSTPPLTGRRAQGQSRLLISVHRQEGQEEPPAGTQAAAASSSTATAAQETHVLDLVCDACLVDVVVVVVVVEGAAFSFVARVAVRFGADGVAGRAARDA